MQRRASQTCRAGSAARLHRREAPPEHPLILADAHRDPREIASTYPNAYVFVPLLCIGPILAMRLVFRGLLPRAGIVPPQWAILTAALLACAWVLGALLVVVRRMRGAPRGQ